MTLLKECVSIISLNLNQRFYTYPQSMENTISSVHFCQTLSSGSNGYILGSFHVLKEYVTPIGIVKVSFFIESKVPFFFAFFEILFAIDNSPVTWVEKISSSECVIH